MTEGKELVIVDPTEDLIKEIREHEPELLVMEGDCTDDDILIEAGLMRADSVLVCTGSDTDNLFIVLSTRALSPNINIIARASGPQNESKMRRAGANRVISPYRIGGQQMANSAIRPELADLLDVVSTRSGVELWLQDLKLTERSPLIGRTLATANLRPGDRYQCHYD